MLCSRSHPRSKQKCARRGREPPPPLLPPACADSIALLFTQLVQSTSRFSPFASRQTKQEEGESAGLCIWTSLWPRQQQSTEAAFCRAAVHWQCQGEVRAVRAELQRHEEGVLGWESRAAESSSGRRKEVRLCAYGSTVCLLLFACELQRVQYGGGRSLQSAGLCRRAALAQAACCIWGCSGITTIK